MRSHDFRPTAPLTLLVLILWGSVSAWGQDKQYRFTLDFGHRWVFNQSGNRDLYRSQLDYGDGPKLFGADFFMAFPEGSNRLADRIQLRMSNWGGEPYNTAQAVISKNGIYELRFNYLNLQYFNSVPNFANPFFEAGNFDSQHQSDISQRVFNLEFTLWPGRSLSPYFAYSRSTSQGPIRTTLRNDGDEFIIGENAQTSSDDIRGGIRWKREKFSLLLEQGIRWYNDKSSFFASGFQQGNLTRPVIGQDLFLEDYSGQNDFKGTVPFTSGIVSWEPVRQLALRAKVSYSLADMNSGFSELASGNFFQFPGLAIFYNQGGRRALGEVKKPSLYGDFSADWQPTEWLLIQERVNIRRFHVSGSLLTDLNFAGITSLLGPVNDPLEVSEFADTFLSNDLDSQEIVATVFITPRLSIRGGHRFESKRLILEDPSAGAGRSEFSWDRNLLILGGAFQFNSRNRLSVDFELGRTDQPPIFRTDAADFHRLRIQGKFSPRPSLVISGNATVFNNRDDQPDIDFDLESRGYGLQVFYSPFERFSWTVEYERSQVDSDLIFIIPQTLSQARSLYLDRGDYGSAYLSARLYRNVQLDLGYSFWDTVGNFPQQFHRPMARLEVPFNKKLAAYLQWNSYDYQERTSLFPQQYQAQMLVAGFRLMLGNDF